MIEQRIRIFKFRNHLNNYLNTSFLEMQQAGNDFINIKYSACDEPYPTIEKLLSQIMTKRDLAQKFERLKILENESHLQKLKIKSFKTLYIPSHNILIRNSIQICSHYLI